MTDGSEAATRIDDLIQRLLETGEPGYPVLTVTADLRPDGSGQPTALRAFRQAMREAVERSGEARGDARRSLSTDEEAVAEAIEGASSDGALGVLYAGSAGADLLLELETPCPFRNSLHIGLQPYLFEALRYRYLAGRPICLVEANLHTMEARRIRYGLVDTSATVDWAKHHLEKHKQRTQAEGFGSRDAGAGGHAMNRVEQVVEARRAQFAAEASGELERFIEPGDLLVLAGVEEARAQLLNRLPESLREHVSQTAALDPTLDEHALLSELTASVASAQFERADARVARWFEGADGERAIGGLAAVRRASEQGRLGEVIVHEDAVDHFGTAVDTRHHPAEHGDEIEVSLRLAVAQAAEVLITREPRVLTDYQGIIGIARY